MPQQPPRIVSLLPSATETLCAIGGAHLLVGRSHECDFPAELGHLPVLTEQTTGGQGMGGEGTSGQTAGGQAGQAAPDSAAIDRQVSESLAAGSPLYRTDEAAIAALKPDLILTQDLCAVCSIDLATVERLAGRLKTEAGGPPRVVSLNPTTMEGVLDDCLTIGAAAGLEEEAKRTVVRLRERLFVAQDFVNPFEDGPVLGFMEWTDPIFCAGHWTVQLIERAGARHPLNPTTPRESAGAAAGPQQGERVAGKSIRVPDEVFARVRPEAIVIAPCGFGLEQTRAAARALLADPVRGAWFRDTPAAKRGRVAIVDGNQMFNRPGPRLVDAYEWLVGWLHGRPELIPDGFPWEGLEV